MFKPARMMRLNALILERDERLVLRCLGELGAMELTRDALDAIAPSRHGKSEERERCQNLLTRLAGLRKALNLTEPLAQSAPPRDFSFDAAENSISALESDANPLLEKRQQTLQKIAENTKAGDQWLNYCGLDLPLDGPDTYSFLHFVTGTLPSGAYDRLEAQPHAALLPLPEQRGRQPLIAVTTRDRCAALEAALARLGFQNETLPAMPGATPESLREEQQRERKQLHSRLQQLDEQLHLFARDRSAELAQLQSALLCEHQLLDAAQNCSHTDRAVLLTGWIPQARSPELQRRLHDVTAGCCAVELVEAADSAENEIPVLMTAPRWLHPFQNLVRAYGLPRYGELEPTLFLAASFILMFGAMFGDLGHGAVLAFAGLIGIRIAKLKETGWLLLWAGGASAVFGAIYGSCFGLAAFKRFALWHDPLEGNPMHLMLAAVAIGMALISLSLILNIINRFRYRDFLDGCLGERGIAGLVFYWGALYLLVKFPQLDSHHLLWPVLVGLVVLPAFAWLMKAPLQLLQRRGGEHAPNPANTWFAVITESFVTGFETILCFFANTISFVRLAAYAMSHAALLLAALLVANAVKQSPAAGTLLATLVIIMGNAIAIVLEGVIAAVQALRLEYYEFFSRFFSGDGRPFHPFCLQTKTVAETPL